MKIVIFGLTISSSWGNGHATLWRGLCKALGRRGDYVTFFERDVPYYAGARDYSTIPGGQLLLYENWESVWHKARDELLDADVAVVTSYCPDALAATELIGWSSRGLAVFYDLDTPVTLSHLSAGKPVSYVGPRGLSDFDLVLSYTGGAALIELRARLAARRVAPLYGHVDPEVHRPVAAAPAYGCDLSYLGTYSADRQIGVESLFINPARQHPQRRFLIGGAQYPDDFPWSPNIYFARHLPSSDHPAFYSSSRLTLNVTRAAMAQMGWCPSGRLFEAAACGCPILSDSWDGFETFFTPGSEIIVVADSADVSEALARPQAELARIGQAARQRTLTEHTSERRSQEFVAALEGAKSQTAPELMEA